MCTHHIQVINKRTGRPMYVKCGKCKSCLQEKANKRTARIRNHEQTTGRVCLFVTLTYDNRFIPYIRPSELHNSLFYNIYRDNGVRYKRKGNKYATVPCRIDCEPLPSKIELDTSERKHFFSSSWTEMITNLPLLRKLNYETRQYENVPDKCGICYYPDFQNFYKRFETDFKRRYGYKPKRSYCVCSEYGETYRRPHFHMLLFCQYEEIPKIKDCIFKAWPFTGNNRKRLDIQIAKNAASYVAQYINCGTDFPAFLRLWFRPKFVTSQNFGRDNFYYHLDSIVRMFERNDWSYPCTRMADGQTFVQNVPLPGYVLASWFPKFTGYQRLFPNLLFKIAHNCSVGRYAETAHIKSEDVRKYDVRLRNAKGRFIEFWLGRSRPGDDPEFGESDYSYLYANIWNSYLSYLMRWSYENYDVSEGWQNYYENIGDCIRLHRIRSDVEELPLPENCDVQYHPDLQPWNVRLSSLLSDLFDKKKKQAKVSNLALTSMGFDV